MEILNKPSLYALLLILPSSLLLTGCYEEFDPQIDQDPVLCVNSAIIAGQPVEVRVTQTWYYSMQYTGNFDRDITVRDAVVELYADLAMIRPFAPLLDDLLGSLGDEAAFMGIKLADIVRLLLENTSELEIGLLLQRI